MQGYHRQVVSYAELLSWPQFFQLFFAGTLVYMLIIAIIRLYFSPIAAFPGPFLAKLTHWYEFYFNFMCTGMYYEKIREMHEIYGPVVRVTPDEIHVMEPSVYHKLFVPGSVRKTEAYVRFSQGTGFEDMTAISAGHDAHRRLRAPLDKLFGRHGILRIETRVITRVQRLCDRLRSYQNTCEVVNLSNALGSLTTDIISSVIFEEPSDYLGDPDFNETWFETLKMGTLNVPLFKHVPWIIRWIGGPIIRAMISRVTRWTLWDEKARRQVMLIRKRPTDKAVTRVDTTVLDHLVHSDLVEKELGHGGFARLAQLIQQAGSYNVSHTLGTIIVYLLHDPRKLEPLRKELGLIWACHDGNASQPSWIELEKAPYLTACVTEGLRMAIGNMNRTPRIFPNDNVEVCGWVIPKGTPVSMSTYWMHNDPVVFPNPKIFDPNRWINTPPETLKEMQAFYVPFAKGSRTCVGQNLVYMQLFHTLAHLFRPGSLELELYDTTPRDIIAIHGLLFPLPRLDSKGVRVTVGCRA